MYELLKPRTRMDKLLVLLGLLLLAASFILHNSKHLKQELKHTNVKAQVETPQAVEPVSGTVSLEAQPNDPTPVYADPASEAGQVKAQTALVTTPAQVTADPQPDGPGPGVKPDPHPAPGPGLQEGVPTP